MDYKRREEIFAKEALSIVDVADLMECSPSKAATLIREWKHNIEFRGKNLHLKIEGKIHVLDYYDVMGIDPRTPGDRYCKKKEVPPPVELHLNDTAKRSVCH